MEGLIGEIDSVIRRPTTEGNSSRTQSFLDAFEQIVANRNRGPTRRKARVWATQHCWLLVVDPVSLHAALWDPVARDRVNLPRLTKDLPRNCKCLLSHEKPTSHGCLVLVVDLDSPVLWYCRVSHHNWYSHEYSFEKHPGFQIQSIAAIHGDFYFSVSPTELVCMELMCYEFNPEPRFMTIEHGKIWLAGGFPLEKAPQHLVESRQDLLVFIQYYPMNIGGYKNFGVWKMDFLKREWTKVYPLNDRVLLVGPWRFAESLPASELGVEHSCVYLIRDDNVMQIRSLKLFACMRRPYPLNPDMSGVYTLAANACGFDVVV
jgi:hypothetical protein